MKRELIYMDAKSSKFWNIEQEGLSHTVTYGRIGTKGQAASKTFPSEEAARKDADKLIKEKLGKGYVDAEGSGADASGAASGELIPWVAFASVNHSDELYHNVGTFVGQRVHDYDPEKPGRSDGVYRFRTEYDGPPVTEALGHFLASEGALKATALVLGAWQGDDMEATTEDLVSFLVAHKDRLPRLAALYVGDIVSEECEISWIKQGDLSPLLGAFPGLQLLRARGGDGLALSSPRHPGLRALALEAGGLDVSLIRSLGDSEFPALEHLELWLGTEDYGRNFELADLEPILSGRLFPKLRYLGLRNFDQADQLAGLVVKSPLVQRVEILDLSLGVLGDQGGEELLKLMSPSLKKLNLHYNFFSPDMQKRLKALPYTLDLSGTQEEEEDDRFVAVGE